ncbi:zinc finger B-box domain-containing protein 1 [Pangasianodon hypophthalmus]|uniref:zinc finger B-box domain-containing protein 1 n=1 Tax=Pangasianodon hypophthalmus TaxID=310915 RepID=UPI002306FD75|nr:zinc finger B-box domain-containing protein 1 [Pangasianodon hypophthalmus]
MNLNNFVVLPNKPKSVKLNVRNLRELRMETAQLSQDSKDMESRLQQLREVMSREKEEREKNGAFRWKSAQTHDGTRDKEKKLNKTPTSKMKIRVLKDEPLPVERVPEPPPPKHGQSRKSRLKGKVCGQCEARTAGLVCAECAEDYCVSCFAKFHQKGALRFHHIIPMQAELHTSISTLDVVNRFQKKTEREEEEDVWSNHGGDGGTDPERSATSTLLQPVSNNQMHSTQVLFVNDADEENETSLLRGNFDEEESSRSFQQALNEWRAGNTHGDREHHEPNRNVQTARPVSMEVMATQAGGRTPIFIEFRDHGLSYMERLLLKKHRRTQIESYQLLSTPRSPQDPITDTLTQPVEETHATHELTAEEMDLHRYCVSLFAISSSAEAEEVNNIFKSCLSITEIDETAGDPLVDASFGVKQRDDKKVNQEGNALAMPCQAEEEVLLPTKPLDFSLKTQTLANETVLSGSVESFSQSPPSDQLPSSLTLHKLQKSVDSSTLTGSEMLNPEQYKEHAFQEAQSPELLNPHISRYPSKTTSTLKCTTQVRDSCSSTSLSSQSHSPLTSTSMQCQSPAFPVSSNQKLSLTHPEHYQRSSSTLNPPFTPRSPLKATSTQSLDSSFFIQSHGPSPSTSIQCLSPAFSISSRLKLSPTPSELYHISAKALTPPSTKSFSHTQSGNTPSQSQPLSELQKSPLSAEQSSSDDEEPYFLPLGSSSSSEKSEILQSSPPLHLSLSNSDMSSDSIGMIPTDEDSSDEEMRRCALQDMGEEEERNTFSSPPSLFPTVDVPFPSQSPTTEEQPGFFTKPSLAVSILAQRHSSVSTTYQGLDGFFTLGLESRSVPLSPAPSHAPPEMQTHSTNSEAFMSGDSLWRPESSLQHHAEAKLVGVVINNQPISIISRSVTPISKMEPSRRLGQSGASAPVTHNVSRPMCASRPISRAALEILEVQSVEQAEITHIKQDEEDLLTITSLEEEFKRMSAEPNLFVSDGHTDNRNWTKKTDF